MIRASVARALIDLRAESFDIMIFDPPYEQQPDTTDAVLGAAAARLAPNGLLVLEHARRHASPVSAGSLARTRVVVSGDSALSFYS
jgi:16S rRNA G966 N2-methylase RsmD